MKIIKLIFCRCVQITNAYLWDMECHVVSPENHITQTRLQEIDDLKIITILDSIRHRSLPILIQLPATSHCASPKISLAVRCVFSRFLRLCQQFQANLSQKDLSAQNSDKKFQISVLILLLDYVFTYCKIISVMLIYNEKYLDNMSYVFN